MSFAEAISRLVSAVAGWLVVYAHCLTLAVAPLADCVQAGSDPFLAATFTGAAALLFSMLIPLGRSVPGVGPALRWLALPGVLFGLLALRAIAPSWSDATFEGANLCRGLEERAPGWHAAWVPFQFVTLLGVVVAAYRVWRPAKESA